MVIAVFAWLVFEQQLPPKNTDKAPVKQIVKQNGVPQLWSDHKVLKITPEQCALKGIEILSTLGFNSITQNEHFVYGNKGNNRAVFKCVPLASDTFVYTAVAGSDVKQVEQLRNEIVWKI